VSWRALVSRREELLRALSPPILSAVGEEDTPSPIFHGCFDWHSAVHGVYSLYAIYHRTGDRLYLEAARQHARADLVEDELGYMQSEIADEENPYGFAWLLALAAKQEQATGTEELRPLAEFAADRVAGLVDGLSADEGLELVAADAYRNLSWALLHLALWARHLGDAALLELTAGATRRHLLDPRADEACPVTADAGDVLEFMPPGLMRLAAVGDVLGPEAERFVRRRLPPRFVVPPVTQPTTVHAGGVNFFRAFALLGIVRVTRMRRIRENVGRLVLYQFERPDLWRSGAYDLRHWVAQIGVRVLDDSYASPIA
jgi:hypothetical protein